MACHPLTHLFPLSFTVPAINLQACVEGTEMHCDVGFAEWLTPAPEWGFSFNRTFVLVAFLKLISKDGILIGVPIFFESLEDISVGFFFFQHIINQWRKIFPGIALFFHIL